MSEITALYDTMKKYQLIIKEKELKVLMNLGLRLKALRTQKSLTQEELSLMIGLGRTSITNIERGKQDTPISTIVRICCALECELSDLLNWEDENDTNKA